MHKSFHFPKWVSPDEYARQKEGFLSELHEIFGVDLVAVYLIGETELPGVSDIDFLVVHRGSDRKSHIRKVLPSFPLVDMPLLIDQSSMGNLALYTHHTTFLHLAGEDLDLRNVSRPRHYLMVYTWKILFMSLLRNFYPVFNSGDLPVKELLSHIHDMRYAVVFLKLLTNTEMSEYSDFVSRFSEFRRHWYENPDTEALYGFLREAIDLSWGLINLFATTFPIAQSRGKRIAYGRYPTVFATLPNGNYRAMTESYYRTISKHDRFLVVPPAFNVSCWSAEYRETLEEILSVNHVFLRTSFDSPVLKLALLAKKVVDFVKIILFVAYAKI